MKTYRLMDESLIKNLAKSFEEALKIWNAEYAVYDIVLQKLQAVSKLEDASYLEIKQHALIENSYLEFFTHSLFGEDNPEFHTTSLNLARLFWQQMFQSSALKLQENVKAFVWNYPGSSALTVQLVCQEKRLKMYLDPDWVYSQLPPPANRPPLIPLEKAMQDERLQLEVHVSNFKCRLTEILNLEVGDFLSLETPIQNNLRISFQNQDILEGSLGHINNYKSIIIEERL